MNRGREKIRQSYLAEEKARKEAEQAVLKATEEEVKPAFFLLYFTTFNSTHSLIAIQNIIEGLFVCFL